MECHAKQGLLYQNGQLTRIASDYRKGQGPADCFQAEDALQPIRGGGERVLGLADSCQLAGSLTASEAERGEPWQRTRSRQCAIRGRTAHTLKTLPGLAYRSPTGEAVIVGRRQIRGS